MCISQKSSAQVLCSGIVAIAREKCPSLLQEAEQVYSQFTTALTLFEKCHLVYNGGVTDDSTIDQLGKWKTWHPSTKFLNHISSTLSFSTEKDIATFMAFYRESFPDATVLPKMHILEDHVIPWMRRWHIGAGLMGEQCAESIHAHINRLENQYNGIVNHVDRLKYVLVEHNVESTPGLNSLRPEPNKYRKRKRDETAWNICTAVS